MSAPEWLRLNASPELIANKAFYYALLEQHDIVALFGRNSPLAWR